MRVVVISSSRNNVVKSIIQNSRVVCIVQSTPRNKKPFFRRILKLIIYALLDILNIDNGTLGKLARQEGINFMIYDETKLRLYLNSNKIDLLFVYGMSALLPKSIWSIPEKGTINLHLSYLPDWRGPFPEFWYYYNHDLEPGVTVHYIDEGEDTGDIIVQKKFSIPSGVTSRKYFDLAERKVGVQLVEEALSLISSDKVRPKSHSEITTTGRAKNIPRDKHEYYIDWSSWGVDRTYHFLKGVESWMNPIAPPFGHRFGFRWVYYEKKIYSAEKHPRGPKRALFGGELFLKDGSIKYKLDLRPSSIIRNLINYGNK